MTDRHRFFPRTAFPLMVILLIVWGLPAFGAGEAPAAGNPDQRLYAEATACVLTITCPSDRTIECNQSSEPINTGTATFTSNPDCGTVTLTHSDAVTPGSCPQERTIARTWTASATSGDVATCVQTIVVQDTQAPQFPTGCNTSAAYQCVAQVPSPGLGGIGPFDACDPSIALTSVRTSNGGSGCIGDPLIFTDMYTATDDCGNSSQCIRTHTVIDDTPPTITCPPDETIVGAIPPCDPADATASDNCGSVTITCSDGPLIGDPCNGTINRTFVATDACGNTASCVQLLTVQDNIPPTIACPADFAIECPEALPPCNPADATVTDGCGDVTVTCSNGPLVGGPCGGTITRTYLATDEAGNTASCDQIITVDDNTPPTIVCPADVTVECIEDLLPCDPADATASDNCAAPVTVTCSDGPLVGDGCAGTITRTFVAVDACGHSATCAQIITVNDATPPTISCPPALTFECSSDVPPCNPLDATVSDNCAAPVTVTCSDSPLSGDPCAGSLIRTYTATDACGNSASCTQIITIEDDTPPTISCPPSVTVECGSDIPPCSPSDVTVTDNCDALVTITCSESPLTGDPCTGSLIRTYTATDACGNTASCTQTIAVEDNTPPVITCPPDISVQRILDLPPCGTGDVTVTDNCEGDVTITCSRRGLGGIGCTDIPIPVTYTFTATDGCGNQSQCVRVVTVLRPDCPFVVAAGTSNGPIAVYSGQPLALPLRVDTMGSEIASFDLAFAYDKNAVTILGVDRGQAVASWEYFTYRVETAQDGWGVIRLIGFADLNNGSAHPPFTAFRPIGELALVRMAISADPAFADHSLDLTACLQSCSDNTVTSRDGDMTFVMAESNVEACASSLAGSVLPGVRFDGLRLDIKKPQSIVGDLNLNRVTYEVGDIVTLTNYLVNGEPALSEDASLRQLQMAASDVNDDGVLMTVADLRYLLRVVASDATPIPGAKLSPYAHTGQAQYRIENGQLTVFSEADVELGGAYFIFRPSGLSMGAPTVANDASGMTIRSNTVGDQFRVLVSPEAIQMASVGAGRHELFTVPFTGDGTIELIEVQMSDAQGALLLTAAYKSVLPTDYALEQNYPNPFNAGTVIPFALKDVSDWTLTVYNVMGQVVRAFSGHNEAGRISVSWDGSDQSGASVASGMYFYRVQTENWNATKKMTLVK